MVRAATTRPEPGSLLIPPPTSASPIVGDRHVGQQQACAKGRVDPSSAACGPIATNCAIRDGYFRHLGCKDQPHRRRRCC